MTNPFKPNDIVHLPSGSAVKLNSRVEEGDGWNCSYQWGEEGMVILSDAFLAQFKEQVE